VPGSLDGVGTGRPRRARWLFAAAVAFALVGGACGGPEYHYVKSTSDRTFVRVPSDWTLYDEDALLESSDESPESKEQFKELSWSVAFDASPKPSLDHVLTVSDHPTGLVQVRKLLPGQRDTFSLSDLRAVLLRFDPLSNEAQDDVEVLESKDITRGHLNGSELLLNLKTGDGDVVKWRQVALVDAALTRVHVLAISCDDECYSANEGAIDAVIDSWKVTER
jgi:hypothetical protein